MTNYGNITKSNYQADIRRKQAFFNRCKRRFNVANTPAERQFLKSEATRICGELKQCCKMWKNCGWGSFSWITRGFTTQSFNNSVKPMNRKNTTRSYFGMNTTMGRNTNSTRRTTTGRTSARRTTWTRPSVRSNNNRTRSNASRMSYIAW